MNNPQFPFNGDANASVNLLRQLYQNTYGNQQNNNNQQQESSQPVPSGLYCRLVNSEDDILVKEVSNTNDPSVFVSKDLNTIYVKKWNKHGTIDTATYQLISTDIKEEPIKEESPKENDILSTILERLETIEKKINSISKKTAETKKETNKK